MGKSLPLEKRSHTPEYDIGVLERGGTKLVLIVMDDLPELRLEQLGPVERCERADQWRVTLKLVLPVANSNQSEWGSFSDEGGFNGVIGDEDITDPSLLALDQRVWQAFQRIGKRSGTDFRLQWLSGSCQLEITIEGGEAVEVFDLATFNRLFQAETA